MARSMFSGLLGRGKGRGKGRARSRRKPKATRKVKAPRELRKRARAVAGTCRDAKANNDRAFKAAQDSAKAAMKGSCYEARQLIFPYHAIGLEQALGWGADCDPSGTKKAIRAQDAAAFMFNKHCAKRRTQR